jgi:hypothetical protein
VLTIWNKYWIEDANKNILGFAKQKGRYKNLY